MHAYRPPKAGYIVRAEVLVVDAMATTFGCAVFIASRSVGPGALWAVGAAVLTVLITEVVRAQATPTDASMVPASRFDEFMSAVRRERQAAEDEDDSWTPTAVIISVVLSPFIAVFILVRLVMLYWLPVTIVLLFIVANETVTLGAAAAALAVGVGADVMNELLVVLPLRRRWVAREGDSSVNGAPR